MGTKLDPEFVKAIMAKNPLAMEDMMTLVREGQRLEEVVEDLERQVRNIDPCGI